MILSKTENTVAPEVEKQRQRVVKLATAAIGLWFMSFVFSQRLPFLRGELLFEIQAFGVFPLATIGLVWFSFLHRWAVSGKSGFQMAMEKNGAWAGRNQLITMMGGVAGLIFFAALAAWTCNLIPAWYSQLFAHTPMQGVYHVVAVKSVSNFREAHLIANRKAFTLPLAAGELAQARLKRGDMLCIRGRTTFTGGIVESISKEIDSCSSSVSTGREGTLSLK